MNNSASETRVLPAWMRAWEEFWFQPGNPAVLGLMRASCGLVVTYTLFAYSFALQDFMGASAWDDLELRMPTVRQKPVVVGTLDWNAAGPLPAPKTAFQIDYVEAYRKLWGMLPPPPYPKENDLKSVEWLNVFRLNFGVDVRINGAPVPETEFDREYAVEYAHKWKMPPPAYPVGDTESAKLEDAQRIADFMRKWSTDPRRVYASGMPVWSVWFHVTDPSAMNLVHGVFLACAVLFTIGFATRITTVLTWFALLCYIHRSPMILFGVDTMMTIVLTYLMFCPCNAVFSIDRLILDWWRTAKPGIVQAWCRFWKLPLPAADAIAPALGPPVESVSANVAIRLLQIHVCFVYLFAGLSKLVGRAWWDGTALWATVANFEFAPMQFEIYLDFLRFLGEHQWLYASFLAVGGWFTLTFEIGYAFLIWRPRLRWAFLGAAIVLHGAIGLVMGLKTFSLMMLVMNLVFLSEKEVHWLLDRLHWLLGGFLHRQNADAAADTLPAAAPQPSLAATTANTNQ